MSPELEALDQLLGGALSLTVIRQIYPDHNRFSHSIQAMVQSGDVRLISHDGSEVEHWQLRGLFESEFPTSNIPHLKLVLTEQGANLMS